MQHPTTSPASYLQARDARRDCGWRGRDTARHPGSQRAGGGLPADSISSCPGVRTTLRRRTDVSTDNAASLTVRLQRTGVLTNRCTQHRAESRQLTRGAARHVGLRVLRPERRRSTSVRVAAGTWTNDCLRSKPRANASAVSGAECHAGAHEVPRNGPLSANERFNVARVLGGLMLHGSGTDLRPQAALALGEFAESEMHADLRWLAAFPNSCRRKDTMRGGSPREGVRSEA